MSDGLITYDGGLLLVDGGLTTDPNCCCYYEPETCPPCCIKIDWGTFDDDGNLVDDYESDTIPIAVKIIMPTPNSRIVCDGEQVTFQWELDAPPDTYGAWVRFGAGWGFNGEIPTVGMDGETYEFGLVDWVGTTANSFGVTLTFRKCFLDSSQFHHFIVAGMDFPDWDLEVDMTRCLSIDLCCPESAECEDCCALLDQTDVIKHDGKYYIVKNGVDGSGDIFTMVVEFELEDAGKICDDGGISIDIYLIPPRHGEIDNNMTVEFPNPWKLETSNPAINIIDGEITATKIDWGTLTAMEYSVSLSIGCVNALCPKVLAFPDISIVNDIFGATGISFDECDLTDCCPPPCSAVSGLFSTGAASSGTAIDANDEECAVDAHWRAGGGNAFIIGRGDPMNYGCFNNWISVACDSIAEPGGEDGFEAVFTLDFEIAEGACLEQIVLYGAYSADNYVKEGEWKVNGVDQAHIPHGSYFETTTIGCIEFEINYAQGGWVVGTNTIAITVKNGFVGSGEIGFQFGLNLSIACKTLVEE